MQGFAPPCFFAYPHLDNTRQGYVREDTLELAGFFFLHCGRVRFDKPAKTIEEQIDLLPECRRW